ncbi:DUF4365 domain-containing protein [Leptolyngbya sp. KIOST-1]|uniref:DUF4365 domain-containing protein n=1 Tax=Leptolyngbya sp. KIOST-1 TaxID=1229172 RepID=UPI0009E03749|nr:DUF4365 domain-containing protein [Leptolyngbya sp. KIOST-1]
MGSNRFNTIEREGVNAVERAFLDIGWIFREQPIVDVGIDAQVEVCIDGKPTGQLIAIQIKSGSSWFSEKVKNGFLYRGSITHLEYWKSYSLPVIIALYKPEDHQVHWQAVQERYIETTRKGWKIIVPFDQNINESSIPKLLKLASAYIVDAMLPAVPYCIHTQEIVTQLAEIHKVDLQETGAWFQLEHKDKYHLPLNIETMGYGLISVRHLNYDGEGLNREVVFDPSIIFFTQYEDPRGDWDHWVPVSMTQYDFCLGVKHFVCASVEENGLVVLDKTLQKDIASFAENWARILRQNGWTKYGQKSKKLKHAVKSNNSNSADG